MIDAIAESVAQVIRNRNDTVLLLCDVGTSAFENAIGMDEYNRRMFNMGILEAAVVGCSGGLSKVGLIPVVFTYGAFLVERCFEQLKIDVSMHQNQGNFISRGGSYDYTNLGPTHHCYADLNLMSSIPGFEIVAPGTAAEFRSLFLQAFDNGRPTYYRTTEQQENSTDFEVIFGKANVIQAGNSNVVVLAIGTALDWVLRVLPEFPEATVLYYTTIMPFDLDAVDLVLKDGARLVLCEPTFSGVLLNKVSPLLLDRKVSIQNIGLPFEFIDFYGTAADTDRYLDHAGRVRTALLEPS